jgi:hypothetical protein
VIPIVNDLFEDEFDAERRRVAELTAAYADIGMTHSYWQKHGVDLDRFRGYGQFNTPNTSNPSLIEYIRDIDGQHYLDKLVEDGAFGCFVEMVDGKMVSRDLLESIVEILFLENKFGEKLDSMTIVDIGAGYGRLAHWLSEAHPKTRIYCTDGVPASTAVCEKYIKYRKCHNVTVVPLHQLESIDGSIELAVNIHSWSECTRKSINWWLDWLSERQVPKLFIIPHTSDFRCSDEGSPSYYKDLEAHGYELQTMWPSRPTVDKTVSGPRGYYVFERKAAK